MDESNTLQQQPTDMTMKRRSTPTMFHSILNDNDNNTTNNSTDTNHHPNNNIVVRRKRSLPATGSSRMVTTTTTTTTTIVFFSVLLLLATQMMSVLQAYAPNHPLHPLHPILTTNTNTATATATATANTAAKTNTNHMKTITPVSSSSPFPSSTVPSPGIVMKSPMNNNNIATTTTTTSTRTTFATPTVDQLELHQLLQRQRHVNPGTTTGPKQHMKTTETDADNDDEDDDEEYDEEEDNLMNYSPITTATAKTPTNLNKKKKIQRKRSGVISSSSSSSRDGVASTTATSRPGKNPTTSSNNNKKNYVPLLTAAEEMEYSYRIRTLRAALRIREQLVTLQNGIYIHPTEEQWCMACGCTTLKQLRRLIHEGQAAKTQLISSNTGLVIQYAKKQYSTLKQAMEAGGGVGTILTLSDMIQEGHFGLIEAAERYQPEKGFRFSTYATYWVKQRILRCISDSSRTIRLPVHVHETLYKIKKAKRTLYSTMGREPTITEIAQLLDISEDRIRSYTASSRNVISLERPLSGTVGGSNASGGKSSSSTTTSSSAANGGSGVVSPSGSSGSGTGSSSSGKSSGGGGGGSSMSDDTRTLLDTIASDGPTPEEDAVLDSMRRDIRAVLDTELATLEQQVVRYRFGLVYDDDYDDDDTNNDDNGNNEMLRHHRNRLFNNTIKSGESYSVRETSQILQISMDRVRLLEARALNKLRHPMRNYKLKDYVQGLGSTTTTTTTSGSSGSSIKKPSLENATSKSNSSSRLRPKTTNMPAVQPLSPLQQWLSFQQSEYNGIEDENDSCSSSNDHTMTKSRLEEAYANSPSSYTTSDGVTNDKSTSSADRFWFF